MRLRLNGWQRLWILVSVLYLLLVGSLAYMFWPTFETTRHRKKFIERMPAEVRKLINGAYASQWEADQEAEEMRAKSPRFVFDGDVQLLPNGALLRVIGGDDKEAEVVQAYADVIDAEVKAQRWAAVRAFALAWFVPCVALYALGWSIGWVYRGFRISRKGSGV